MLTEQRKKFTWSFQLMQKKHSTKFNTFIIKKTQKTRNTRKLSPHNKIIYEKSTANVILNVEILKTLSLRSGTRQWYSLLPPLFNIVLKVLPWAIKQEKKYKTSKLERDYYNFLFGDYLILYIEILKTHKKIIRVNKWIQ